MVGLAQRNVIPGERKVMRLSLATYFEKTADGLLRVDPPAPVHNTTA